MRCPAPVAVCHTQLAVHRTTASCLFVFRSLLSSFTAFLFHFHLRSRYSLMCFTFALLPVLNAFSLHSPTSSATLSTFIVLSYNKSCFYFRMRSFYFCLSIQLFKSCSLINALLMPPSSLRKEFLHNRNCFLIQILLLPLLTDSHSFQKVVSCEFLLLFNSFCFPGNRIRLTKELLLSVVFLTFYLQILAIQKISALRSSHDEEKLTQIKIF